MAALDKISKHNIVDKNKEEKVGEEYRDKFNIKCTTLEQRVESLSGGNQQKVVLAKWIFTSPNVLILDEPTRGVDVGAKYEIYSIINRLVEDGAGAIFISSDLTEIIGVCDRVYVMHEGRIIAEMDVREATQESIMHCIVNSMDKKVKTNE